MRIYLLVALAFGIALSGTAKAADTCQVVSACGTASYTAGSPFACTMDTKGNVCNANGGSGGTPTPVTPGNLTTLGQQTVSSTTLATAQSLTVPTGATVADFYPEGSGGTNNQCVRYRDDGTAPTGSTGSGLAPQQLFLGYTGKPASGSSLTSIQFILATGATCTLTINYYK